MKILLLFHCEHCNNKFEEFCESGTKTIKCSCGKTADRIYGRNSIYFPCGGFKTGYTKPSTPIEGDIHTRTVRFPHYADRNTGRDLGFGAPEISEK